MTHPLGEDRIKRIEEQYRFAQEPWLREAVRDLLTYLREVEKQADTEMLRVKACEHIAEGIEGWERLRNECPSTAAVADLRDVYTQAGQRVAAESYRADLNEGAYTQARHENSALRERVAGLEGVIRQVMTELSVMLELGGAQ